MNDEYVAMFTRKQLEDNFIMRITEYLHNVYGIPPREKPTLFYFYNGPTRSPHLEVLSSRGEIHLQADHGEYGWFFREDTDCIKWKEETRLCGGRVL